MTPRNGSDRSAFYDVLLESPSAAEREVLSESAFGRTMAIERKRTERSGEPFLLMLLEADSHLSAEKRGRTLDGILSALVPRVRDTDVIGWYKDRVTVGVIYTGLLSQDRGAALSTILQRVSATLRDHLTFEQITQISISFHVFPDDWDHDKPGRPSDPTLYKDLQNTPSGERNALLVKRLIDILGSAALLLACSPLLLLIALCVKLTSKGPVLFRQQRVGQYGRQFMFLKFRSMRTDSDDRVHRDYVKRLIAGEAQQVKVNEAGEGVYKLAHDPRITPIGRFLRRTSLDELPQFLNVLRGEMSLVGPRPAIPYELAAYQTWHRRRVLQVKPGITGLWQVMGRSRVKFDEMVRLDLRYAETWSPLLDLKILLRTPGAVVKGAY